MKGVASTLDTFIRLTIKTVRTFLFLLYYSHIENVLEMSTKCNFITFNIPFIADLIVLPFSQTQNLNLNMEIYHKYYTFLISII